MMWYVRVYYPNPRNEGLTEGDDDLREPDPHEDIGPWERVLAELMLADVGVDGTWNGSRVTKAILIEAVGLPATEHSDDTLVEPKMAGGCAGKGELTPRERRRLEFYAGHLVEQGLRREVDLPWPCPDPAH